MKKILKGMPRKVLSVMLAAALVAGLCPAMPLKTVSEAATGSYADPNEAHGTRTRLVLKNIEELPYVDGVITEDGVRKPKFNSNYNLEKGTNEKRPFTILEIVGYEEKSELGYFIDGCEPVRMDEIFGLWVNGSGVNNSAIEAVGNNFLGENAFKIGKGSTAYFFLDEKESELKYYSKLKEAGEDYMKLTSVGGTNLLRGYYEVVSDGSGNFAKVQDGDGYKLVRKNTPGVPATTNWNIVWHTVNDFAKNNFYFFKADRAYAADFSALNASSLQNLGDRYYAYRKVSGDDPVRNLYDYYYFYENKDVFLTSSLGLSREDAADYSVAIKTITPSQLNANPEWVECADLIYLYPKSNAGSSNASVVWLSETADSTPGARKYANRMDADHGTVSTFDNYDDSKYKETVYQTNDLTWNVVARIMDKITASENYAALIMEKSIFWNNTKYKDGAVKQKMYDIGFNCVGEIEFQASNNNVFKLAVMTLTINPNLAKQLFWKYIDGNGNFTSELQTGDAQKYWSQYSLTFMPEGSHVTQLNNVQKYIADNKAKYWQRYGGLADEAPDNVYVQGRVYTYNSDVPIGKNLVNSGCGTPSAPYGFDSETKYSDFENYLTKNGKTLSTAAPADAIGYILGLGRTNSLYYDGSVRVLDIEPSVGLGADGKPNWKLRPVDVQLMLPNFGGTIELVHQTTGEFVGKIEDLNSTYDMIYIGSDIAGFNQVYDPAISRYVPDFNDTGMYGQIYFHVGDKMVAEKLDVAFLQDSAGNKITSQELRFGGNDITKIKKGELESYINAGRPVAAADDIYNFTDLCMDKSSYMYAFLKAQKGSGVYRYDNTSALETALRRAKLDVVFREDLLPSIYNGSTHDTAPAKSVGFENVANSARIPSPNYLTSRTVKFGFEFNGDNYAKCSYVVKIDEDMDGKCEKEILSPQPVTKKGVNQSPSINLASTLLGVIPWKIVVYETENPNNRVEFSACSAIAPSGTETKKKINVLQIMPDDHYSVMNISKSSLFWKYTKNPDIKDFDISLTTIRWTDFEEYFKDRNFSFNISLPVNVNTTADPANQNPKVSELRSVESGIKDGTANTPLVPDVTRIKNAAGDTEEVKVGDLSAYNMIIIGFGDSYGSQDLSNLEKDSSNKAVQYLQYFAASGKSILYTHDVTSYYNVISDSDTKWNAGTTANAVLRDQLGMNRYKALSYYARKIGGTEGSRNGSSGKAPGMLNEIKAYQDNNDAKYDKISSEQKQGFTYMALKRLGYSNSSGNANLVNDYKVPYYYMINDVTTNAGAPVPLVQNNDPNGTAAKTGFNNNYDITFAASKLNSGQITEYPYKISDELAIVETHGQVYQLNMEDPNVTVWYTLADSGYMNCNKADGAMGTSRTYNVSPKDAANNYYIYSKGNIFYSGVGHRPVEGAGADMEAKLFVNTMVAAYRQAYDAPSAVVTNEEAFPTKVHEYRMLVLRENNIKVNEADHTETLVVEDFDTDSNIKIFFKLETGNLTNEMSCRIAITNPVAGADDNPIIVDKVWREGVGSYPKGAENKINGLKRDTEYYFLYPKAYLENVRSRTIKIEVWDDKSSTSGISGTTYLYLDTQPLFLLD